MPKADSDHASAGAPGGGNSGTGVVGSGDGIGGAGGNGIGDSLGAGVSVGAGVPPARKKGLHLSLANREVIITRRHFLYGAAGLGAVAAAAVGARLLESTGEEEPEITTLAVAPEQVMSHEDYTEVPADYLVTLIGDFTLPYGSLVWVNDDTWAACLLPTETPSPLTHIALLSLESGEYYVLLDNAVAASEGFEIYDVRATSSGAIWTEANIFEGRWRVYAAPLSADLMLGSATMLEEGDAATETPTLAAVGDYAFWQTMPQAESEEARRGPAFVRRAKFNALKPETVFEGKGRFGAPLYACEDAIVFAPRHADSSYFFQLAHMDASTGQVDESITLPEGMHPNQLGYGPTGFAFSFDAIYENNYGIANLGTYTPVTEHDSNYDNVEWFRFGRTPLGPPAWCGHDFFLVKSTRSVCAVDMANKRYCAIDIADGSADWGDYLVSSGVHGIFATSQQIDYTDTQGETSHRTQVRLWQAVPAAERLSTDEILAIVQAEEESKQSSDPSEDLGPSTNNEGNQTEENTDTTNEASEETYVEEYDA